MRWTLKKQILLLYVLCMQGCVTYTFSGITVPSKAKTFSAQFQPAVKDMSREAGRQFMQVLDECFIKQTSLKKVAYQGDLRFAGTITGFAWHEKTDENTGKEGDEQKLTVTVEVSYLNPFEEGRSFEKKSLSESVVGNRFKSEKELIKKVFGQLSESILQEALSSW